MNWKGKVNNWASLCGKGKRHFKKRVETEYPGVSWGEENGNNPDFPFEIPVIKGNSKTDIKDNLDEFLVEAVSECNGCCPPPRIEMQGYPWEHAEENKEVPTQSSEPEVDNGPEVDL